MTQKVDPWVAALHPQVSDGATTQPGRPTLVVQGPGAPTVADDPANKQTVLTFPNSVVATKTVDGSSATISKGYGAMMKNGKLTLASSSAIASSLYIAGLVLAAASANQSAQIITSGLVDPAVLNLGAGVACAVGLDTNGKPVRVTDPACVTGLKHVGACDANGAIYVNPRTNKTLNVKDYGAIGGATDCTAAIQATFDAALQIENTAIGDGAFGGAQTVEFPNDQYRITSSIKLYSSSKFFVRMKSHDKTTLLVDSGVDAFVVDTAGGAGYAIGFSIDGFIFKGGRDGISLTCPNNGNVAIYKIANCEFHELSGTAIKAHPSAGAYYHVTGILSCIDCVFILCGAVVDSYLDKTVFDRPTVAGCPADNTKAAFKNRFQSDSGTAGQSTMTINDLYGTGLTATGAERWIDNYGNLFLNRCRFGGEAGGFPIIYNWAGALSASEGDTPIGPIVSIRDCSLWTGSASNSAVMYLPSSGAEDGAPNSVFPETFILEGNQGPQAITGLLIKAQDASALQTYIDAHDGDGAGSGASRFRIAIDQVLHTPFSELMPKSLLPYVETVRSSIMPMGSRLGTLTDSKTAVRVFRIPVSVFSMAALVTVSAIVSGKTVLSTYHLAYSLEAGGVPAILTQIAKPTMDGKLLTCVVTYALIDSLWNLTFTWTEDGGADITQPHISVQQLHIGGFP